MAERKYPKRELLRAKRMHDREDWQWSELADEFDAPNGEALRSAVRRAVNEEREELNELVDPRVELPDLDERFPDWKQPEDVDWREALEHFARVNKLHEAIDPYQETLTIDLSTLDRPIAVAFAGDLHMGGGFTSHKAIKEKIDFVLAHDDLFLALLGDTIEGFIPGVKPAEASEQQAGSIKLQLAAYKSLIKELARQGKVFFATWGDHDAKWFEQLVGVNLVKQEIHDKVPYFQGRGLVTLKLGDAEYYVQANHSERFNSQWNPNHPQRRQFERFFPADVNVSAHKHQPAFQCFYHYSQARRAGLNIGGKTWLVATGTFKTGPDPHTMRSWERGRIGVPTAVFHPDTHDVDVFESPEKAVERLEALEADG